MYSRRVYVLRGLAAILAILVAVSVGATKATSQQQVPQENSVLISRYDNAVERNARLLSQVNHKQLHCDLQRARSYVKVKRTATWGWQDKILVPRTRSSFRERVTHSCGYTKWIGQHWAGLADDSFRTYVELSEPRNAICHVFGVYCSEAIRVSWCESRHDIWASNGQYLGLFQMGSRERKKYGHATNALGQSIAAYAYFRDTGSDWSPWSCKP